MTRVLSISRVPPRCLNLKATKMLHEIQITSLRPVAVWLVGADRGGFFQTGLSFCVFLSLPPFTGHCVTYSLFSLLYFLPATLIQHHPISQSPSIHVLPSFSLFFDKNDR